MASSEQYLASASVLVSLTGLAMATAVPGALASGLGVLTALDKLRQTFTAKTPDLNQQVAENLASALAPNRELPPDAEPLILQMIGAGNLTSAEVMAAGRSGDGVCNAMLEKLTDRDHLRSEVQSAFRTVVTPILTRLLDDPKLGEKLRPAFEKAVLEGLQEVSVKLERLVEEVGLSAAKRSQLSRTVGQLEGELGTTKTLIVGFLETILEKEVAPDQVAAELFQIARQWDEAVKRISVLQAYQNLSPRLGELRAKAQAALTREDVEAAWAILSELDAEEDRDFAKLEAERVQLDEAVNASRQRRIENKAVMLPLARSRLDLAQCIALSIDLVDLDIAAGAGRFERLLIVQTQWSDDGRNKGLAFDLEVAIALAREAVERARDTLQRATAMNALGVALLILGEREAGTARLQEALDVLYEAVQLQAREGDPRAWAMTQTNLGNAFSALGARETGKVRLQSAVDAYQKALEVQTRVGDPQGWLMTQNNLGNALRALGEREITLGEADAGTARLQKAVEAYHRVLELRTPEGDLSDWAMVQNNLGHTLMVLGELESSTVRLEQALEAFYNALEGRPRRQVPFYWATTQHNLACVLGALGQKEPGTERLQKAIVASRSALEVRTQKDQPFEWAMTQTNIAVVELVSAHRLKVSDRRPCLDSAEIACRAALEVFTPQHAAPYHSRVVDLLKDIEAARVR